MARTWEQEKAWRARRAEYLGAVMETALANNDDKAFEEAYEKSLGYMSKKLRRQFMERYAKARISRDDWKYNKL